MHLDLIEELLNDEESATLDFKSEQYAFINATDEEKGELLKDILAFANAWRRTDAYILTGVKDVKGGRSKVIGIKSDFDDAYIQQFVNSKTNRNIEFSYKTATVDGEKIGIFHIPLQDKPFYLKKDFGKIKAKTVYVRRSSSTGEADLDEVAKMGTSQVDKQQDTETPKLELQFYNKHYKMFLGSSINLTSKVFTYDEKNIIKRHLSYPDYAAGRYNTNFEHELARYVFETSLVSTVSLNLTNIGSVIAKNARLETLIMSQSPLLLFDKRKYPSKPSRNPIIGIKKPTIFTNTEIELSNIGWYLSSEFGNIQPKAAKHSDVFYIGVTKPCVIKFESTIYADNLPEPLKLPLTISFNVISEPLDTSNFKNIL